MRRYGCAYTYTTEVPNDISFLNKVVQFSGVVSNCHLYKDCIVLPSLESESSWRRHGCVVTSHSGSETGACAAGGDAGKTSLSMYATGP